MDGGKQKRCFTDIRDGIEALYRIIENGGDRCDGEIINIGNPENEASIRNWARCCWRASTTSAAPSFPTVCGFSRCGSSSYYGKGYQDVEHRKPSIRMPTAAWTGSRKLICRRIDETLDFFLRTVDLTDKPS
ncbi:hypothetical protein ACNKHW_14440 [Shigella flexneri]